MEGFGRRRFPARAAGAAGAVGLKTLTGTAAAATGRRSRPGRPGRLRAGLTAVGYGCPLVSVEVSGRTLREALEQQWAPDASGVLTYAPLVSDAAAAVGDRVAPGDVLVAGAPLRPEASYGVVAPRVAKACW